MKYSSVFICVFGKFVFNNSQMSGEKSLRSLVDMKMMDNPVLFTIKIGNGGYYEYCVGSSCET